MIRVDMIVRGDYLSESFRMMLTMRDLGDRYSISIFITGLSVGGPVIRIRIFADYNMQSYREEIEIEFPPLKISYANDRAAMLINDVLDRVQETIKHAHVMYLDIEEA